MTICSPTMQRWDDDGMHVAVEARDWQDLAEALLADYYDDGEGDGQ